MGNQPVVRTAQATECNAIVCGKASAWVVVSWYYISYMNDLCLMGVFPGPNNDDTVPSSFQRCLTQPELQPVPESPFSQRAPRSCDRARASSGWQERP